MAFYPFRALNNTSMVLEIRVSPVHAAITNAAMFLHSTARASVSISRLLCEARRPCFAEDWDPDSFHCFWSYVPLWLPSRACPGRGREPDGCLSPDVPSAQISARRASRPTSQTCPSQRPAVAGGAASGWDRAREGWQALADSWSEPRARTSQPFSRASFLSLLSGFTATALPTSESSVRSANESL